MIDSKIKYIIYLLVFLGILGGGWFLYSQYSAIEIEENGTDGAQQGVRGGVPAIPSDFRSGGGANDTKGVGIPEHEETRQPPASAEQKLLQLTTFPVISPFLNETEDKILFYKKEGGDLLSSDFSGSRTDKISNLTIVGILEAKRSPARDRSAVRYLDNETIKSFLHIATSSVATLPQGITSISWSPSGDSLAYLLPNGDGADLIIGDDSGNGRKTEFSTPILDASIAWVSKNTIAFQTAPSGFAEGYVFAYSRNSNLFRKIIGPEFGLTSLWSPDGSKILTTAANRGGGNIQMTIRDASGKPDFVVNAQTLSEKCVWADDETVYCAVPRSLPADVALPDDYLRGELNTEDQLVSLDLASQKVTTIFNEGNFDMSDLVVTKDQKYLFFVDRNDGTLWRLMLK